MGTRQYQLVYREKGTRGAVLQKTLDAEARVNVREITSLQLLQLRVSNISLYRHNLVLEGRPYDIINIIDLGARQLGVPPADTLAAA